jgi:hypothetical protein
VKEEMRKIFWQEKLLDKGRFQEREMGGWNGLAESAHWWLFVSAASYYHRGSSLIKWSETT